MTGHIFCSVWLCDMRAMSCQLESAPCRVPTECAYTDRRTHTDSRDYTLAPHTTCRVCAPAIHMLCAWEHSLIAILSMTATVLAIAGVRLNFLTNCSSYTCETTQTENDGVEARRMQSRVRVQ